MSKKRGKQARGIKTKQSILNTALTLFSEKGYDNVTVDEITEKSNSSKGSFYFHFGSKHNILLEKFTEIDNYYLKFYQNFPSAISASEQILLFIQKQMEYIQNELGKDLMKLIYSHALLPNHNEYFVNQERLLFQIIGDIIEEGQQSGEITRTLSIDQIKYMMMQGMMGAIYHWCMSSEYYDLQEKSADLFLTIVTGLKNTP